MSDLRTLPLTASLAICCCGWLTACVPANIGLLGGAAKAELRSGFSPQIRQHQQKMQELDYAQLFIRWEDGRELIYLLADRRPADGALRWIGPNGSVLLMQGPTILSMSAVRRAIEGVEVIRPGSVQDWVRSPPAASDPGTPFARSSLLRLQQEGPTAKARPEAITIRASIIERTTSFYTGLAFTGAVERLTERAEVIETGESLLRYYWVEPLSGALLRMQGDLAPNLRQILMEWTRVPTIGQPPIPRNYVGSARQPSANGAATGIKAEPAPN